MNKQEAVLQIMEIKTVLPEQLQTKLIEAVKVLATFKMINVEDDMPYNHPRLSIRLSRFAVGPLCLVRTENGDFHIDNMASDINGIWSWQGHFKDVDGDITHWFFLRSLTDHRIIDEFGNELKFE